MLKICTLILLVVHLSKQTCTPPMKVSILYEALCSDSVDFISNQLERNYEKIKSSINLEFVPYGKATHTFENNRYKFVCPKGDRECALNKYHACGLKYASTQDNQVKFVNCMMTGASPDPTTDPREDLNLLQKCSLAASIPTNKVDQCRASVEGEKLLADQGVRTQTLKSNIPADKYDVPVIIFRETYNQQLQNRIRAQSHFLIIINEFCSNQIYPQPCYYCVPGQNYYNPYTYGGYGGYGIFPYAYSHLCGSQYPCNNYYQPYQPFLY